MMTLSCHWVPRPQLLIPATLVALHPPLKGITAACLGGVVLPTTETLVFYTEVWSQSQM
jgi:hypothetical protein